jgi:four helix bundle protein
MDDKAYRKLQAWQKAMEVVDEVYRLTSVFPADERFGLTSQMRRCAVSVPSNIAEGYGRDHRKEYIHHLSIARGSLMELETQLIIAVRQQFCTREAARPIWSSMQEAGRLMSGLIQSLRPPTKP